MNIAFFSKQLPSDAPNGVSCQVHRLAQALSLRGHEVTCFSFSPPCAGARYRHVRLSYGTSSRWKKKFIPAVRFAKVDVKPFDILHYHGDDYWCRGGLRRIRTFYGSALQEALHARSPGRFWYQSLFYLFELLSSIKKGRTAGISRSTARCIPGIREVIPCGVPLDRFCPDNRKSHRPSILFLGDRTSRKRGRLLIEQFTSVVLPALPESVLTIIGPEPCRGPGIRYLGPCDEERLIREYQAAWTCCMPSSYEGFGVPLIEAMACGTAVIATPNAGNRDIIRHGHNGLLCRPAQLGPALQHVLQDTDRRQVLVRNALADIPKFDIHTIAARYEKMYALAQNAMRGDG